jgi:hypothetical protein
MCSQRPVKQGCSIVATNTSMKRGWKLVRIVSVNGRNSCNQYLNERMETRRQGKLYASTILLQHYLKRMWNGVDLLIYDSYGSTSRWLRHP